MNLDELKAEWAKDSIIKENDLNREALRTPQLHSKYLELLINAKMKLAKLKHDLARVEQFKIRYWKGELTKEELTEYNLPQWQYNKPLKSELESMLAADEDCILIKNKMDYCEMMIYFLESVMNAIKSRGWDIRNAVEYLKFQAGM